jgi:hypothetical protein
VKRTRIVPIVIAVCTAALLAGCSSVGGAAATVNGESFSERDFEAELAAQRENEEYWSASQANAGGTQDSDTVSAALAADWLTRHIYTEIVAQSPIGRRSKPDAALRAQVESQLSQTPGWTAFPARFRADLVESNAIAFAAQRALGGSEPTSADLVAFFEQYRAQICASDKVVSHILVATEAEATAVVEGLSGGGDFATLAKERSTDTGSGAAGGGLGCLGAQQFVAEFEAAAQALAVGATSAPVQTQFGWHVIRVEAASYEALREAVAGAYQQVNSAKFQRWVQRRVREADVTVNPRYGTWRRSQGAYTVVPPTAPAPQVRPAPERTGATGTLGSRGTPTP